MASAVLLVVGLTVVLHDHLDSGGTKGADTSTVGGTGATTATTKRATGVDPGAVTVAGTVTSVHIEGAVLDPRTVPTPLTLTATRAWGTAPS